MTDDSTAAPLYRGTEFRDWQPPKIPPPYRNYQPPAQPSITLTGPAPTRNRAAPGYVMRPDVQAAGVAAAHAKATARAAEPDAPTNRLARLLQLAGEPLTANEIHDATGIETRAVSPMIARLRARQPGCVTVTKQPGSNYRLYQWTGDKP